MPRVLYFATRRLGSLIAPYAQGTSSGIGLGQLTGIYAVSSSVRIALVARFAWSACFNLLDGKNEKERDLENNEFTVSDNGINYAIDHLFVPDEYERSLDIHTSTRLKAQSAIPHNDPQPRNQDSLLDVYETQPCLCRPYKTVELEFRDGHDVAMVENHRERVLMLTPYHTIRKVYSRDPRITSPRDL
ncbi:hypothetical protein BP5796_12392 [Coleophoma crateriformis]|uniref:Uncharacterized protein n=1 Tax=Coleophoma crateriformis TaxID=565419 RepID=A0A3D8Q9D8_9HELO|nr:hypothetical protein BP5796_12392 [Coleophoma crateriformis]